MRGPVLWGPYRRMLDRIYEASYDRGARFGRRVAGVLTLAQAAGLIEQADAAARAGQPDRARTLYHDALAVARGVPAGAPDAGPATLRARLRRASVMLGALAGSADVERLVGARDEEMTLLRTAQDVIHEALPGTAFEATVVNRMGVALFEAGHLDEAIDTHERALAMLDDPAPFPPGLKPPRLPAGIRSMVLSSLGNAYSAAGSRDRAARLTAQALAELPESARGGQEEATCLSNAAAVELPFGDLEKAAGHPQRAAELDTTTDPRQRLAVLNNLGHTRLLLDDLTTARKVLEEAETLSRSLPPSVGTASVLNNLAVLELRSDRPDVAAELFERAAQGAGLEGQVSRELAWAQANLAVHHLDAGRVDEAVQAGTAGVASAEAVRRQRPTSAGREELSEHLQTPYQVLIAALHATGDTAAHARAFS